MQLLVLGSASSQGIPQPLCSCPLCQKAKRLKGKNRRLRSSYLVNLACGKKILLDISPDFPAQQVHHQFDFDFLFLSHRHRDHIQGLKELRIDFGAHRPKRNSGEKQRVFLLGKNLNRWLMRGPHDARWEETTQQAYQQLLSRKYFKHLILTPFKKFILTNDVSITYIRGYHGKIYSGGLVIQEDKKSLVYLADIGYLNHKLSKFLNKINATITIAHSPFFNQISEDADPKKHLSIEAIKQIPGKKILLSHFSHSVKLTHEELIQKAKKIDPRLIIAFDDQEINL